MTDGHPDGRTDEQPDGQCQIYIPPPLAGDNNYYTTNIQALELSQSIETGKKIECPKILNNCSSKRI